MNTTRTGDSDESSDWLGRRLQQLTIRGKEDRINLWTREELTTTTSIGNIPKIRNSETPRERRSKWWLNTTEERRGLDSDKIMIMMHLLLERTRWPWNKEDEPDEKERIDLNHSIEGIKELPVRRKQSDNHNDLLLFRRSDNDTLREGFGYSNEEKLANYYSRPRAKDIQKQ